MSERVVELPRQAAAEFERTPPQDIEAEQSVLGGMLLSKDAIADVVEVLRSTDFYRPAHQTIYDKILDLYGRGEPADAVTLAGELTRSGELARIGGAPYLHTLIACVPTAANAGYYARSVHERAVLRRLVEAGTRIVQLGYADSGGEVDDLVDRAQQAIYDVTERRTSEDYTVLGDVMQPAMDEMEAISSRAGTMTGVPTGFTDLDTLTNGLHPGQLIVVAGRPGLGKALALDTPLPTPSGWTTMGEVQPGDLLLGADGRPVRVVGATEVMHGRPCYEVEFSDGTVLVADAQHQWLTDTRASRRSPRQGAQVRTTEQLARTVRCATADGRADHSVRTTEPLQLPAAPLPLAPYVLGAWLGDVHSAGARITCADAELLMFLEAEGVDVVRQSGELLHGLHLPPTPVSERAGAVCHHGTVQALLRTLGVLGDKHVPASYLRASEPQRRALLAGLLDTHGTVTETGDVQLAVTSRRLADDVHELVLSLGYTCTMTSTRVAGRTEASSTCWTLTFTTSDEVFRLSRKQRVHKERHRGDRDCRLRYVVDVRPVTSVPVRCVEVDDADHLYLAGRSMVPTHNSTLGLDVARSCSIKHGMTSAIFSLEMSKTEITMRLLSAEARIGLHHMRTGTMSDDDWARLARRMGEVADAPLFIDDSPNLTMMEIRAKARRLKQRHDLKLIIIDYLQLMTGNKKAESRQQEVSELSRNLKLLAKELEVPVIAMSQLNRGPEQRTDKKPQLADLRESGCLTAETRILRADTGAEATMGELLASGERDVPVWALDESLRYVRRTLTHVFPSGTKPVFRLRLSSGREVRATANHPFLTYEGWTPLGSLAPGDRIAAPRHVLAPDQVTTWDDRQVALLAHMIGDGSCLARQPVRYASVEEANLQAVTDAAAYFGITAVRDVYAAARFTSLRLPAPGRLSHGRRNPVAAWFDELGLFDKRSHEKFVPEPVFALPKRQITLFLRHLWATDGSVWVSPESATRSASRVYYASTSRRLVDDVARLLWRYGIQTRITTVHDKGAREGYTLDITSSGDQEAFCRVIGVHGDRGVAAERLRQRLQHTKANTDVDTIPRAVWGRVRDVLAERDTTHREFATAMGTPSCGSAQSKHSPSRSRLARVAQVLEDDQLEMLATNDVTWDEVVAIDPDGVEEVYDATVLGGHNFIANGIAVHNSIEQDADMVILLYREDAFEKESPRAGEADLIVAKHRNGPTQTITVASQLHYSRFVDMSTG